MAGDGRVTTRASIETSPEIATADTLEVLEAIHHRYEVDASDLLVEGLRIAAPDVDEDRLHEAADWTTATTLAAINGAARAWLRPLLQAAFEQPNSNRRRRDVNRLLAAEHARLEEGAGIALLEPALSTLGVAA